jgi:hypothetical protein
MQQAAMVKGNLCVKDPVENCPIVDQQYKKTGRDDKPSRQNNLIFSFTPSENETAGPLTINAPPGFAWAPECVITVLSSEVFGIFTSVSLAGYSEWPAGVAVSNCRGHGNTAVFDIANSGGDFLVENNTYVFRVNSITNPPKPLTTGTWSLEFGSRASKAFSGFGLWSLTGLSLEPSNQARGFDNTITFVLTPQNTVPLGGYLHVVAPGGFRIAESCQLEVSTQLPPLSTEENKFFFLGDFACVGVTVNVDKDRIPTNQAKVRFVRKTLLGGVAYVIRLQVQNPDVVRASMGRWQLSTHWSQSGDTYELLDAGELPGFPINDQVGIFKMESVPPPNGLDEVRWELIVQLREAAFITDIVAFTAPLGYDLRRASATASSACAGGLVMGPLALNSSACTSPCFYEAVCKGNSMVWRLKRCPSFTGPLPFQEGMCLPPEVTLRLALDTRNPANTPVDNRFLLRHADEWDEVVSSGALPAYDIIPLLTGVTAELVPGGPLYMLYRAVGSETTARISFVPAATAQTVRFRAHINSNSFKFSDTDAFDGISGQRLVVNERSPDYLTVTTVAPMEPGRRVSVRLTSLGNPSEPGISNWDLTTFEGFHPILGKLALVNEKLHAPGFEVLGFITVLTSSSVKPSFYGSIAATANIALRCSRAMQVGDTLLLTAPRHYAFASELVATNAGLHAETVRISKPAAMAGTYALSSEAQSPLQDGSAPPPMYKQVNGAKYLYWRALDRSWAIGSVAGGLVTGQEQEAYVSAGGAPLDPPPPVASTRLQGSWLIGSASGWIAAPTLVVSGQGQLLMVPDSGDETDTGNSRPRLLSLKLGAGVAAAAEASVAALVDLPSDSQEHHSWLFQARRQGSDYATNDLQFQGFALLWPVVFTITPALSAPQARSTLWLAFKQERALPASQSLIYELAAPLELGFPTNCLSEAEVKNANRLFQQCVGTSNTARLVTWDVGRIKGQMDKLRIELVVDLPTETPETNLWTLSLYLDDASIPLGQGEANGFDVVTMPAWFKGSNQFGVTSTSYITFRPQAAVLPGQEILITPPREQGYTTSCWGVRQGNLPKVPACTPLVTTDALKLVLPESGGLAAGRNYTVGVGVTNAARTIPDRMNVWSAMIRDSSGNIRDANHEVRGVRLGSSRLSVAGVVVYALTSDSSYMVTIDVSISRELAAGVLSSLRLLPPMGFRATQVKASSKLPLPELTNLDASASRDIVLTLNSAAALPQGEHQLEVMGTASGPSGDPTWLFQAIQADGEAQYQQVMLGSENDPFALKDEVAEGAT